MDELINNINFKSLLDRIPVAAYRSTLDGKIVYANKKFYDIIGVEDESEINSIDVVSFGERGSYYREVFIKQMESYGIVKDYYFHYTTPDGSEKFYLENANAVKDTDGNILFFEGIVTDITQFKLLQDALFESEEKYRLLFEKSEDAILLLDGPNWADCNNAALKMFAANSKDEIIGSTPYKFSPYYQPDGNPSDVKAIQLIDYAFENGFAHFEWLHLKLDGTEFYVDVMLTAIPYRGKALLFTLLRDISERKAAAELIQNSEEKLRLLFEQTNDGIIICESNGMITQCNQAICNITGYCEDELIGTNILDLYNSINISKKRFSTDDLQALINALVADEPQQSLLTESHIRRKDGTLAYIKDHSIAIKSRSGLLIATIIKDFTDIKNANEEIHSQKELFEKLLHTSPIPIALISFDGKVLFASERIYDYFQKSNREFPIDAHIKDYLSPESYEKARAALNKLPELGIFRNLELEIVPYEGNKFFAEVNASLVKYTSNESDAVIITLVNINQRREAELLREKAAIANVEAIYKKHQAIQLLDNSARLASIGVIAGGIIHEISQPVNAIRIGSEGIISWNITNGNVLPSAIINMLTGISTATERIDNIVKHMRSIWIDKGYDSFEVVDLNDAVHAALNLARMRAQSHEIIFELSIADERLPIWANKVQLELIVNNLITNSVNSLDKTDKSHKLIKITTSKIKKHIFLVVYDNGVGLPNVQTEQLFDPFFSTRHEDGGTGLGLAIVKMFLNKFGANIEPANNAMGGATFIVSFNLADTADYV